MAPARTLPLLSKIQPGQSLEPLRAGVQRFGALAGRRFLQLDENGAGATPLKSGPRLELEYVATADRLLIPVEVPGPVRRSRDYERPLAGKIFRGGPEWASASAKSTPCGVP